MGDKKRRAARKTAKLSRQVRRSEVLLGAMWYESNKEQLRSMRLAEIACVLAFFCGLHGETWADEVTACLSAEA